ncbi:HAD family hydrolase [Desulfosporosinus fructosivorans]|uniref:HAD family hydrolase n=1 Tax=Desulfosporosinus fructosivorans TaxID=2018669 RepID=A0A4Z0R287_9FIRM|nr:HAD hydrolase-like protein [Desulfosporosinus fructosivorans]TGE36724.1 HAD family hydrolase [Desulfosporosinus fructosivorans]
MIQAILFDLEDTLINIDAIAFMRNYLGILAPRFAHLLSPDKFSKQFSKSLEVARSEPKPGQTNIQSFYDDFSKATGQSIQTLQPIFEEFYESDFPALRCLVQAIPQGVKVVEYAIQQGFLTAVASNAILPLNAMQEHISWAGLTPEHFKIIPSLDNFHFFKPHLGFFREVAESLGVKPDNCLIVSGHTQDLVCRELGMKTFFVGSIGLEETDYAGNLDDLFRLIGQGNL